MKSCLSCFAIAFATFASSLFAQETTKYSVDFNEQIGVIKPLNGINLWTNFSCGRLGDSQKEAEACNFSTVRLHDVPLVNDGIRLVDVQHIFGNFHADPTDPKNYYFEPTDDYVANIRKSGADVVYRLGTSIEHTQKNYYAKRPKDPEKYAEICAAIVRHYNAGWADGFEWNLPYWEIWNEPNLVPNMWDSTDWKTYCDFYVVVAKRLRAEFPNIKIGGPALTHVDVSKVEAFLDACKEADAPLDFFSWHCYAKSPSDVLDPPFVVRDLLDKRGFVKTELHLNEWHYFPAQWSEMHGTEGGAARKKYWIESEEGLSGVVSAAFNDYVLTRWQDGPLDMSNYYAMTMLSWGLFDVVGKPRKTYYSMVLFGELTKLTPKRVKTTDGGDFLSLIAGVDESGATKRLLVSSFKRAEDETITISLSGVPASGTVEVARIDLENAFVESKVEYSDGALKLNVEKSGVYMIRF